MTFKYGNGKGNLEDSDCYFKHKIPSTLKESCDLR